MFEKLREAALAYQLERHWDKDKILTEYLNEIYFGEGAYGIEEAAKTYFGWNHPGCGGRPDRCAWRAPALGGGHARRHDLQPERLRPGDQSAGRHGAPKPGAPEHGRRRATSHRRSTTQYSKEPLPKPSQIQTPTENSKAPYFTSLAAPAARRQVRSRARRSAAGCACHSTLDLPFQDAGPEDCVRPHRRRRPQLRGGRARQPDGRSPGDGRRHRLLEDPVQSRDAGTASARLLLQAVHPRHRPRAGSFARSGLPVGPSEDSRSRRRCRKKGGGTKVVPETFDVSNYGDEYLGSASIATATTYSDNSVYSQLGTSLSGGIGEHRGRRRRRWVSRPTSPPRRA